MREEVKRKLFPAENALVKIPAFRMLGRTARELSEVLEQSKSVKGAYL
jgi:hypothetical protein